jgi:hypothetical protein
MPFEVANQILTSSEDILLFNGPESKSPFWRKIRYLFEPFDALFLTFHGSSRMMSSVQLAAFYAILILVMIAWVLKPLGFVSPENVNSYIYAGFALLAIAITFARPSRYAMTGYDQKNVARVLERMPDSDTCTKESLAAIHNCLKRAEDETNARVTTVKWVAGIPFAIALYMVQKGIEPKFEFLFSYALLPLILALFIAGFISCHSRATFAVYGLAFSVVDQLQIKLERCSKRSSERRRWLVGVNRAKEK